MKKSLAALIIFTGIIITILGGLSYLGAADGSLTGAFSNGKTVTCNADISAKLITLNDQLQFTTTPSCKASTACIVNPAQGLSILGWITGTDVEGTFEMRYNNKLYDTADIVKNRFAAADNFALTACLPQDATTVNLFLKNPQGGTYDSQQINIQ